MSITVTHNDVLASYNELFTSYKDMFTSYSQYIVFFRLNTTAAFHTCTRLHSSRHLFVLFIIDTPLLSKLVKLLHTAQSISNQYVVLCSAMNTKPVCSEEK